MDESKITGLRLLLTDGIEEWSIKLRQIVCPHVHGTVEKSYEIAPNNGMRVEECVDCEKIIRVIESHYVAD